MPLGASLLLLAAAAAAPSSQPPYAPAPTTYPFTRMPDRNWNAVPSEEPPVPTNAIENRLPADAVELTAAELAQTIADHSISSRGNRCGDCDSAELFERSGAWHVTYWGRAMETADGEWRLEDNRVCVLEERRPVRKLCRRMWRDAAGQLYLQGYFLSGWLFKVAIG